MPTNTYIITGTDSGIGRSTVEMLRAKGHLVIASILNGANGFDDPEVKSMAADFSKEEDIARFIEFCETCLEGKQLAGVVLNAGVVIPGPIEGMSMNLVKKVFDINFFSSIKIVQKLIPHLRLTKGRIVFIGSASARFSAPLLGSYQGSKAAVRLMADSLRQELLHTGIKVTTIEPGPIKTAIWDTTMDVGQQIRANLEKNLMQEYGELIDWMTSMAQFEKANGAPIEVVIKSIKRALFSKNPKAHYLAGWNAHLQVALLRWVPTRLLDKLVMMGLKSNHKKVTKG